MKYSSSTHIKYSFQEPMKLELEKSFCCFCCKSGPLAVTILIPFSGYVPGQNIPITAEVDNASNINVDRLKIVLRKIVVFKTNTPRRDMKKDKITIAEISVGPVEAHGSKTWQQNIEIPPLPPSNLINCGIIDLDYELKACIFNYFSLLMSILLIFITN